LRDTSRFRERLLKIACPERSRITFILDISHAPGTRPAQNAAGIVAATDRRRPDRGLADPRAAVPTGKRVSGTVMCADDNAGSRGATRVGSTVLTRAGLLSHSRRARPTTRRARTVVAGDRAALLVSA
jgi:hypothetical protein